MSDLDVWVGWHPLEDRPRVVADEATLDYLREMPPWSMDTYVLERDKRTVEVERDRLLDLLAEAEPFITSATAAPPELRTRVVHALIGPPIGRETE